MAELSIAGFLQHSDLDWPGKSCSVVYVPGCNFRCGYCFSNQLVLNPDSVPLLSQQSVLHSIANSHPKVSGVVVSGGEPTLHGHRLMNFLSQVHSMGLLARIETNGSNPFMVSELLSHDLVDSVVVDLKAPLYAAKYQAAAKKSAVLSKVKKSIDLLQQSGIDVEFRLVVVPGIHSSHDVFSMAKSLKNARRLVLGQFWPHMGTIDPAFQSIPKTEYETLLALGQGIDRLNLGIREIRIRTDKGEETVNEVRQAKTIQ